MKLGSIASNDSTLKVFVQSLAQFFHCLNFSEEAAVLLQLIVACMILNIWIDIVDLTEKKINGLTESTGISQLSVFTHY